jgi:hypothetical protein
MKLSDAFAAYNDTTLTLIGLGLFVAVFIGSIIWVSLKENKKRYAILAERLLQDGEQV